MRFFTRGTIAASDPPSGKKGYLFVDASLGFASLGGMGSYCQHKKEGLAAILSFFLLLPDISSFFNKSSSVFHTPSIIKWKWEYIPIPRMMSTFSFDI